LGGWLLLLLILAKLTGQVCLKGLLQLLDAALGLTWFLSVRLVGWLLLLLLTDWRLLVLIMILHLRLVRCLLLLHVWSILELILVLHLRLRRLWLLIRVSSVLVCRLLIGAGQITEGKRHSFVDSKGGASS